MVTGVPFEARSDDFQALADIPSNASDDEDVVYPLRERAHPKTRTESTEGMGIKENEIIKHLHDTFDIIDIGSTGKILASLLLTVLQCIRMFDHESVNIADDKEHLRKKKRREKYFGLKDESVSIAGDIEHCLRVRGHLHEDEKRPGTKSEASFSGLHVTDRVRAPSFRPLPKVETESAKEMINKSDVEAIFTDFFMIWGSDIITIEVLSEGLDRLGEIKQAFFKCDLDNSGSVEAAELRSIMAHLGQVMNNTEFAELLNQFDRDGDGEISWQEFLTTMCVREKEGCRAALNLDALVGLPTFMIGQNAKFGKPANIGNLNPLERYGMKFLRWRYRFKENIEKMKKTYRRRYTIHASPTNIPHASHRDSCTLVLSHPSQGGSHVLDEKARKKMRWIEKKAILLAVFAGILSAVAAGVVDVIVNNNQQNDQSDEGILGKIGFQRDSIIYVWPVVLIFSFVEMSIMYMAGLSSALDITALTGLKLFPEDEDRMFIIAALARSALQVGNPKRTAYGVNPTSDVSRGRLFLVAVVYIGKKGLTTIFLKLLLKRVLLRCAAKSVLSFVAVPVNAMWNSFVMRMVMREIRVCSIGPSFIYASLTSLFRGHSTANHNTPSFGKTSYHSRVQFIRAVGICIVNKKELHPNLETLLRLLRSLVMDKFWQTPKGCRCLWLSVQEGIDVCPLEEHNFNSTRLFLEQLAAASQAVSPPFCFVLPSISILQLAACLRMTSSCITKTEDSKLQEEQKLIMVNFLNLQPASYQKV
jgi:Ca2+-binding EF-hand superfamily protein